MALKRRLSKPLTEDEASSLTEDEKVWLRSWNRGSEIPGEDDDQDDDSEDEDEEEGDDYSDLSVDELKAELKERDLPTSGNKDDLVQRLVEDDEDDE
jgi:hypothetical protein